MLNMLVILNNIIQFILYVCLLCKRYSTVEAKEVSCIIYEGFFPHSYSNSEVRWGRRGRRVVGVITTYAISAHHH